MSQGLPVSGDGFITLADGTRRWGRFGAAGVLVRCATGDGTFEYFLARRSEFCHQGGWSYWTVIVEVTERFTAAMTNWETAETAWIAGDRLDALELLVPFRATLTRLGVLGG